jgi:hypothetical protein
MKRLFLVLMMILSSVGISAQEEHKLLTGHVEIGWVPMGREWASNMTAGTTEELTDFLSYVETSFRISPERHFFIGGRARTYQFMRSGKLNFRPIIIDYLATVGFIFRIEGMILEIGMRHYCGHPVVSTRDPVMLQNRAYEEVYVRFEF